MLIYKSWKMLNIYIRPQPLVILLSFSSFSVWLDITQRLVWNHSGDFVRISSQCVISGVWTHTNRSPPPAASLQIKLSWLFTQVAHYLFPLQNEERSCTIGQMKVEQTEWQAKQGQQNCSMENTGATAKPYLQQDTGAVLHISVMPLL